MSTIYVPPEGPLDARIAFVGEGPGRDELLKRRPFVGPTGRELDSLLSELNLARSEVYLTNVEKTTLDKPDLPRQAACLVELAREFERMPNLNVVIALGAIALDTLSGWQKPSITRWRGTLFESALGLKTIGTYHPAYYMRGEWRLKPVVLADLQRAVEQSHSPTLVLPQRRYYIEPTYGQAIEWLHHLESAAELGVDIETTGWGWGQTYVSCVGFAPSPLEGYCIPIMGQGRRRYWSPDQELQIWRAIAQVLIAPSKKYLQNCMFDIPTLNAHYIKMKSVYMDTMLAHHLLYPDLPHGLDFISSIYTLEPYYKDEGKSWNLAGNLQQFWTYNAKDCVVTLEAGQELDRELTESGMSAYFHEYVMPLVWPLMEMQRVGIRVDHERRARLIEWLNAALEHRQAELNAAAGFEVNAKSPKDVAKLFANHGILITRQTPTGKPKLDEESIHEYCRQAAANKGQDVTVGTKILEVRETRTLLSNFTDIETTEDDHYHFSLLIHGTKPGRLSGRAPQDSEGDPLGPQPQNIPHEVRGVFCARPGYTLLSGDLKQAEAIHVAVEANDEAMMEIFNSGGDIHRFNGKNFFRKAPELITKKERDVAKRLTHGFDYGMSPRKSVAVMAKNGEYITEALAKRGQQNYFDACPGIVGWQVRTGETVKLTKTLTCPFGRRRVFLGNYDDDMYREALSQIPQAVVAYITNMAIIRLYEWFPDECRVVLQVHDEVLSEVPIALLEPMITLVHQAMTIPYRVGRWLVTIPVDIQHGPYWHNDMTTVTLPKAAPVFQLASEVQL